MSKLEKELSRVGNNINRQVLLSFIGDPYCETDEKDDITRQVLELLLAYQIPIAILTKAGNAVLKDLDLFKKFDHIKVGQTLTFTVDGDSKHYEPGAPTSMERLEALRTLHDEGIKTFASYEPVIKPIQSLALMRMGVGFIDQYKIGKANYMTAQTECISWQNFGNAALDMVRHHKIPTYFKKDLRKYMDESIFTEEEKDHDFLALKKEATQLELF